MMHRALALAAVLALGGVASAQEFATPEEYFEARVEPHLEFCRTCHVAGGIADVPDGRAFQLSSEADFVFDGGAYR